MKTSPWIVSLSLLGALACDGAVPAPDAATDAATDGGADAGPTPCATDEMRCEGVCVSTSTDPSHCGGCGIECSATEQCVDGSCVATCPGSEIVCADACVDPLTDTAHCGASGDCTGANAGTACATDETCVAGACMAKATCVPEGTPGVTMGAPSGVAVEGGAEVAYTIVLDSAPCADVVITIDPGAQLVATAAMITFTGEDWNTPQTVQVAAIHDSDVEGEHTGTLTHTIASADPNYDGLAADDVTITIEDRPRARITHVSVPMSGTATDGRSVRAAVSDDGRWVAFVSSATNLTSGDSGAFDDVFLRDTVTGVTTRITNALDGSEANGSSVDVAISADGSVVAFFSNAQNLVTDSVTTAGEVYVWDATSGIRLMSATCAGCNNEISSDLALSGDGAYVAYATRRRVLASDPETEFDIFVRRIADGTTTLESLNSSDANGTTFWGSNAFVPRLSADGRYLGFRSPAGSLDTPELTVRNFHAYVKDRTTRTLTRVSRHDGGTAHCDGASESQGSGGPFVSSDGNTAVFDSACPFLLGAGEPADTGFQDVFVRDIAALTTTRISRASDGSQADGDSTLLGMSDDARYVLFASTATNLVAGDTNGARDLFVHDRTTGTTTRVNTALDTGELAEGLAAGARVAAMSRNGRFVVFATSATIAATDGSADWEDVYTVQVY